MFYVLTNNSARQGFKGNSIDIIESWWWPFFNVRIRVTAISQDRKSLNSKWILNSQCIHLMRNHFLRNNCCTIGDVTFFWTLMFKCLSTWAVNIPCTHQLIQGAQAWRFHLVDVSYAGIRWGRCSSWWRDELINSRKMYIIANNLPLSMAPGNLFIQLSSSGWLHLFVNI